VAFSLWGEGGVLLLSSSWSLSNEGIRQGDNLALVLNALDHRGARCKPAVTFDEYHQGYGAGKSIVSLIGSPAKLGLGQLGLAFLVLVLAVSRRFGQPVLLREGARQRSEYLSSMSSLLRKGHAVDLVRAELGSRFLQEAAAALGLPPNAGAEAIMAAATKRRPDKAQALRRLVDGATGACGRADEASLLALAGEWHQMRKELAKTR